MILTSLVWLQQQPSGLWNTTCCVYQDALTTGSRVSGPSSSEAFTTLPHFLTHLIHDLQHIIIIQYYVNITILVADNPCHIQHNRLFEGANLFI